MSSTPPLATTTNKATLPLFVAAESLSLFGNASISIVLPWLVLSRTGDPSIAGLVAAVAAVPSILATLVGGWLIDHVGQRRMSVIADVGSAISVAGLAIVDWAFGLNIGWFVLLGVLGALFDVPGMTARETLMGRVSLTSGVVLDRVAAIRQGIFGVSFLAGPAVAGLLLTVLDPIRVVWVTAACSALAALSTLLMPLVAPAADEAAPGQQQPGGLATLWASPALRAMVVIAFGNALLAAPLLTVLLPAHFQRLGQADWLGYTMSAFAAGSIVGSILYGVLAARSRRLVYLLGLVLQTVGMAGFASLQGFWLVAAGSVLIGVGGGLLSPIFLVFFTERVAERVRGRVLSLVNALGMVATPIGLSLMALLLTRSSLNVGAMVVFVGFLVVFGYAVVSRGMREFAATTPSRPEPTAEPAPEPTERSDASADH
jgi:MFS family permease